MCLYWAVQSGSLPHINQPCVTTCKAQVIFRTVTDTQHSRSSTSLTKCHWTLLQLWICNNNEILIFYTTHEIWKQDLYFTWYLEIPSKLPSQAFWWVQAERIILSTCTHQKAWLGNFILSTCTHQKAWLGKSLIEHTVSQILHILPKSVLIYITYSIIL